MRLVAAEGYAAASADVQSQLGRLNTSGADTLALFATPGVARVAAGFAARLGWRPLLLVSADASDSTPIEGAISIAYLKDPRDAAWRADPGMRLYRAILARYARGANPGELAPRSRDGGRSRDGPAAEGRRCDPDACRRRGAAREAARRIQPISPARDRRPDERNRALPDRAGAAPAPHEGLVEALRRPLEPVRGPERERFPPEARGRSEARPGSIRNVS